MERVSLAASGNSGTVALGSRGRAGFDVLQHDALRIPVRRAVSAASAGKDVFVSVTAIAQALVPPFLPHA
jgi:hypothetical protein